MAPNENGAGLRSVKGLTVSQPPGGGAPAVTRPRVVVIGAGFGGLAAVQALRNKAVKVTWIDRRNHHLFQPLLYQVATAALSPADIALPVRGIARRCNNVDVVMDEVVDIDAQHKAVRTRQNSYPYDFLIVATGSETSYFGKEKWRRFAAGLKTLEEAVAIRNAILLALERAEIASSAEERKRLLTFVLIGAGPTGVEMAGAIADLAKHMLARDFPRIEPDAISVTLLEAEDQVLPGFAKPLADFAQRKLESMGVEVRTETMVEDIEEDAVCFAGRRHPAGLTIWSAGVKATPVAGWLGVDGDKKGRVGTGSDLSVPGHPEVFVIGDAALFVDENDQPLPGLAAVAKQQGRFVGRHILGLIKGHERSEAFHYRDWGTLATMGRASAVADFGWLRLRGFGAWIVWALVHIWYLIGFRNRLRVVLNWFWQYARYAPGAGLIVGNAAQAARSMLRPAARSNNRQR